MKEAIVGLDLKIKISDVEIPKAASGQLVIKVVVSGTNPKDWKMPGWFGTELNQGDDVAGVVHEVGKDVVGFQVGDRVVAFHEMLTPHGSYAEYAVAWDYSTIHIPEDLSFEGAATLPLAILTAAVGLYEDKNLSLPSPWDPTTKETPLLIYGGSSAVGAFSIQLAQKSNIHPIIAVAGRGGAFVEGLIDRSKGDTIIDYRGGDDAVVAGIKSALNGKKLLYAFDAVSEKNSYVNITKVIDDGARITVVLPGQDLTLLSPTVNFSETRVHDVHQEGYREFGHVHWQNIKRGLQLGWLKPHPYEVVDGGLEGLQAALGNLQAGKASGFKYVVRVSETPGL